MNSRRLILFTIGMLSFAGLSVDGNHSTLQVWGLAYAQPALCGATVDSASTQKCSVKVTAKIDGGGNCVVESVNPPQITMIKRNKVKLVFLVNDDDGEYQFCTVARDGFALVKKAHIPYKQFAKMWATDDDSDTQPEQDECRKRFRVLFNNKANANSPPNIEHDYKLYFRHSASGATCVADPWVKNGSGSSIAR